MRGLNRLIILILMILFAQGMTYAEVSIPQKKQIKAEVVRYYTATEETPMRMPTDVAVDSKDQIYVADGTNHRVLRFDPQGRVNATIALIGDDILDQPAGIAIDPNDNLWVADSTKGRLVIFDNQARHVKTINIPLLKGTHDPNPTDLVITPNGSRYYVVDNDNHRLLVHENRTDKWKVFGKKGRALGQFDYPFMVCLGTENYVYITEAMGARLHRLSPDDKWSGIMSSWGVELGKLYRPKGVAADAQGQIFVSDSTLQVIQVFDPWGRIDGVLCDDAGQPLRFAHPMGLCFDNQGRLLVTELAANRIAVVNITMPKIRRN